MFFLSFRVSKRNIIFSVSVILVLYMLISSFVHNASYIEHDGETHENRAIYLSSYGYDISNSVETVSNILIPAKNHSLFLKYNELQRCCGFDLEKFCDTVVNRYSYEFENNLIVSILVADGQIVGGDTFDKINLEFRSLCGGNIG